MKTTVFSVSNNIPPFPISPTSSFPCPVKVGESEVKKKPTKATLGPSVFAGHEEDFETSNVEVQGQEPTPESTGHCFQSLKIKIFNIRRYMGYIIFIYLGSSVLPEDVYWIFFLGKD